MTYLQSLKGQTMNTNYTEVESLALALKAERQRVDLLLELLRGKEADK